jgi:dienelactone hydrolase
MNTLAHLGPFSDLPPVAIRANKLWPRMTPGATTSRRFLEALHFNPWNPTPMKLRVDKRWSRDGLHGEAISWSVGYGPRTEAWTLKPAGAKGKLPGVLILHDHGGYKYFGKEKVADGPRGELPNLVPFREEYYGRLPIANILAKRGFVVMVHDTFLWGSRKFPLETMMAGDRPFVQLIADHAAQVPHDPQVNKYNAIAGLHENIVEKYAHLLGTSIAGIVNFEDRVAATALSSRKDVRPGGIACLGLSGGGMRSVLLNATSPRIKAAVVIGAMMTYPSLLNAHVLKHTWMLYPPEFPRLGDWSDAVACRAPSPLLVQYCVQDPLYSVAGMKAAHRRIQSEFRHTSAPKNYRGRFYPTTHQFNLPMQKDAFAFLESHMV